MTADTEERPEDAARRFASALERIRANWPHIEVANPLHPGHPDARLIAAAPDLLEALRALLNFNEELCADVGVSKHYPSADRARAAIEKATGAHEERVSGDESQ